MCFLTFTCVIYFRTSEKTKATNQVKELADANKQLSLKLTKETEKLSAVQAERNNTHEELVSCE